jgi:hypothetical protein
MRIAKDDLTGLQQQAPLKDLEALNERRADVAGSLLEAETLFQEVITLLDIGLAANNSKIRKIFERARRVLAEGSDVTEDLDEDLENILPDAFPTLLVRPLAHPADFDRAETECIEGARRLEQVQTELRRLQGNAKNLSALALRARLAQLSAEMFDIPPRLVAQQRYAVADRTMLCEEGAD